MKFGIAGILMASVLLNGCIKEVTDLQEEIRNQSRLYPNDSASRVLNEMKRPLSSETSTVSIDSRDAHIAALEQELSKLREQPNRIAATAPIAAKVEKTFVIVLRDEEFFASGSAKPTQDVIGTLRRTAEILKPYAAIITRIRVDGHTDNRRIRTKRFRSNQELSEARAQIIAWYLQRETGFSSDRFTIRGHGATKPLASNGTSEGRTRNRRVEIAITSNGASPH